MVLDDGRTVDEPDPRHHPQRMHDALEEVCDRLLRSGTLPDTGGTPSTVIITIPEGDLAARRRWGVTSDGTMLSADTVADVANEADVYPTVIGSTGVVLQVGRTRRLATPGQTVALIARDGGCSFPGCDRPPEWCERHHILEWAQGGKTDLDNLTLLCAYHHHNFASRGWTCLMIDGLPPGSHRGGSTENNDPSATHGSPPDNVGSVTRIDLGPVSRAAATQFQRGRTDGRLTVVSRAIRTSHAQTLTSARRRPRVPSSGSQNVRPSVNSTPSAKRASTCPPPNCSA